MSCPLRARAKGLRNCEVSGAGQPWGHISDMFRGLMLGGPSIPTQAKGVPGRLNGLPIWWGGNLRRREQGKETRRIGGREREGGRGGTFAKSPRGR